MSKDIELWSKFQLDPTPETFGALHKNFEGVINANVNKYGGGPRSEIPRSAMYAKAVTLFDTAIKTYDPTKGTKLSTHIYNNLQPLSRYYRDNKTINHIPDNRSTHIWRLRDREQFLTDHLGREPSTNELAEDMKLPLKTITMLRKEMKSEHLAEEGLESFTGASDELEKFQDNIKAMMMDLSPTQQNFVEYLYGMNGRPKLTIKKMSKKMGVPESRVRYIQKQVRGRYKEYFNS